MTLLIDYSDNLKSDITMKMRTEYCAFDYNIGAKLLLS